MNQEITEHVDNALATVRNLFTKVVDRISVIKPGETLPATKMAADLAAELGTTGPAIYPVVKMLLTNFPGVELRAGARGGIFRPDPNVPAKVVKPSIKKVNDTATNLVDDVVTE